MCNSGNIRKLVFTRGIFDGPEKGFRPFGNSQFTECLPSHAPAYFLIIQNSLDFVSRIKSILPTLTADRHDLPSTLDDRMVTDNVNIAVVGILVADEVRMVLTWPELDIVLDEIAFVDEVLFNNLLKYVFFVCQSDFLSGR